MAYLAFDDGSGLTTLRSAWPAPGDRFAAWTPMTRPYGDAGERQSDRAVTLFKLGTSYGASFELRGIAGRSVSGTAPVDDADRLVAYLLAGGQITVGCEDVGSHVYTAGLFPGTTPSLTLADPANGEYTLALQVQNLGSAAPMRCHYLGT